MLGKSVVAGGRGGRSGRMMMGGSSSSSTAAAAAATREGAGRGSDAESFGPVTAVDVSTGSDYLVCGYECGRVALWDLVRGTLLKAVSEMHSCAVVGLRYWKPGSVVSVDVRPPGNLRSHSDDISRNCNGKNDESMLGKVARKR